MLTDAHNELSKLNQIKEEARVRRSGEKEIGFGMSLDFVHFSLFSLSLVGDSSL